MRIFLKLHVFSVIYVHLGLLYTSAQHTPRPTIVGQLMDSIDPHPMSNPETHK